MSILKSDDNGSVVQAFRMPKSGATEKITTVAGVSKKSLAALTAGFYRINVPAGADVNVSSGAFATATALITDMPLAAGEYYFYFYEGDTIAIYDAIGANAISITLMP